jgi:3-mercaptopyruvate sulfurtransferase SseA
VADSRYAFLISPLANHAQAAKYRTLIGTADLAERIDDPTLVVVDCRYELMDVEAGERAYRAGHLPGARYMNIDRDLSGVKTGRNGHHHLPAITALNCWARKRWPFWTAGS